MRSSLLVLACSLSSLAWSARAQQQPAPPAGPPSAQELADAAQRTLERLRTEAVSWTAMFELNGGLLRVRVISAPGKGGARYRLAAAAGNAPGEELLDVITRDGRWYVAERGGLRGVFRPYEAPFTLPTALLFLIGSELRVVDVGSLGVPLAYQDGVLTATLPLPPELAARVKAADDEMKRSGKQPPPDLVQALREAPRLDVDVTSGLIVGGPVSRGRLHVTDVVWSPAGAEQELTPPADLPDFTAAPDLSRPQDLALVAHAGAWQPGQKAGDTDACLLDLHTGAFRRVPFTGALSLPGCFLPGRKAVVVMGVTDGSMRPVEVDLASGQNRPIGGQALAGGVSLFPALSPDGKRLALLHRAPGATGLSSRVHLVDLASGGVRAIGQDLDLGAIAWWPDGESLLLHVREHGKPDAPPVEHVARLLLSDGRLTKLFPGASAALIRRGDADRILFRAADGAWQDCALDGSDPRPLGDGQPRCALPSVAPDGRRVMFFEARPPGAPGLVIVDAAEGARVGLELEPLQRGLWTIPTWR